MTPTLFGLQLAVPRWYDVPNTNTNTIVFMNANPNAKTITNTKQLRLQKI